jgi:hypothetical protein
MKLTATEYMNVHMANGLMAIFALVHENSEPVGRQFRPILSCNSNEFANSLSTAIGGKRRERVEVGGRND